MCGIAGIWGRGDGVRTDEADADVRRMLVRLRHRGPDGDGVIAGKRSVLGACRLAVLDVAHGAQPMQTRDGRYGLAFNGEVVNHVELRAELEARGSRFRTDCDTEVLLELLAQDGAAGLARVNGMFAGAFADFETGTLLLFRDPCGIKPLYWMLDGDRVLFASEPKGLLAAARERPGPCHAAVLEYLAFQVPMGEETFLEGVRRLLPGRMLHLRPGHEPVGEALPEWSGAEAVPSDPAEAHEALRAILDDAVRIHLRSDVPVGAHLSGGVDSSLVSSLASRHLGGALQTFTGAFPVDGFDEREHARAVAADIGATCHEVEIGPRDLVDALPRAAAAMDEPAAGPGLLAQWFVGRLASQHVKVVLGGQGGDELFGGYVRHLVLRLELALRAAIEGGDTRQLRTLAPHMGALDGYGPLLRRAFAGGMFHTTELRYFWLVYRGGGLEQFLAGDLREALQGYDALGRFQAHFEAPAGEGAGQAPSGDAAAGAAARFDRRYLLPALLHVEDRTSMAWSLESRVPLLDRRVLAFVDRCPPGVLFGDGELKSALRRAAGDLLPSAARRRTDKMGFPVPLAAWARGPLNDFFLDLLGDATARTRGFYDQAALLRLIKGETVDARSLWALVNLELWHRTQAA